MTLDEDHSEHRTSILPFLTAHSTSSIHSFTLEGGTLRRPYDLSSNVSLKSLLLRGKTSFLDAVTSLHRERSLLRTLHLSSIGGKCARASPGLRHFSHLGNHHLPGPPCRLSRRQLKLRCTQESLTLCREICEEYGIESKFLLGELDPRLAPSID